MPVKNTSSIINLPFFQLVYKVKSSHLQDQLSSVHADKLTDGQISALYGELKETLLSIKVGSLQIRRVDTADGRLIETQKVKMGYY